MRSISRDIPGTVSKASIGFYKSSFPRQTMVTLKGTASDIVFHLVAPRNWPDQITSGMEMIDSLSLSIEIIVSMPPP